MNPFEMLTTLGVMGMVTFSIVKIVSLAMNRNRGVAPAELARMDERLSRMEQAIDAVAVEMERVSEGQRFTTKLLSERAGQHTA